jgi:hypothetical protein
VRLATCYFAINCAAVQTILFPFFFLLRHASQRSSLYPESYRTLAVRWHEEGLSYTEVASRFGGHPGVTTIGRWCRFV